MILVVRETTTRQKHSHSLGLLSLTGNGAHDPDWLVSGSGRMKGQSKLLPGRFSTSGLPTTRAAILFASCNLRTVNHAADLQERHRERIVQHERDPFGGIPSSAYRESCEAHLALLLLYLPVR